MQTDRRRPFYRPSWLLFIKKKNLFKLDREFDGSNPYMQFGRNPIKNDLRVTTTADTDRRAIVVIVRRTKPVLTLEGEFDRSNLYLKSEINLIKND